MENSWVVVKVHPCAKKEVLISIGPGRFEAWVKAKPLEGRANQAVADLLARALHISPVCLRLTKGAHNRNKVFKLVQS